MKVSSIILATLFQTFFVTGVFADSETLERSYKIVLPDQQHVFIMLGDESILPFLPEVDKLEEMELRERYKQSGLYSSENCCEPLWTVNWYAQRVFVSSNRTHIVRLGRWATTESDEAFSFFDNGRLIESYTVGDLVDFKWLLPHSVSHFQWLREAALNDARNEFVVRTLLYDKFVFDIRSGEMITAFRFSRIAIGGLLTFTGGVIIFVASRRKMRSNLLRTG